MNMQEHTKPTWHDPKTLADFARAQKPCSTLRGVALSHVWAPRLGKTGARFVGKVATFGKRNNDNRFNRPKPIRLGWSRVSLFECLTGHKSRTVEQVRGYPYISEQKQTLQYQQINYPGKRPQTVCVRSRGVVAESPEI